MFEIEPSKMDKIDELFDLLSKFGDIYFKNKRIYLFAGDTKRLVIQKRVAKLLGVGEFILRDIAPNKYDDYPPSLAEWMKNKSYIFEVAKLEKEKQAEIKEFKEFMEKFIAEDAKKDGDVNGTTEKDSG
jgi:hypothetical protein